MGDKQAAWINLYGPDGRLQAQIDPRTLKLIIRSRGVTTEHDLLPYVVDKNNTGTRQVAETVLELT